jgi:hypothetical protein
MLHGLMDQNVIAGVHLFTGTVLVPRCCMDVLAVWFLWLLSGKSANVHVNQLNVNKNSANALNFS